MYIRRQSPIVNHFSNRNDRDGHRNDSQYMSSDTGSGTSGDVTPAAAVAVAEKLGSDSKMVRVIKGMTGGAILGTTDVGASWCLKALHPSDSNVQSSPCPVTETKSFATVAYNQLDQISIPATFDASKPWNLTVYTFSDADLLYTYIATQGSLNVTGFVQNRNISSTAGNFVHTTIANICERYRVTSRSNTMYFDAASTSDQGHVITGQFEMEVSSAGSVYLPVPTETIAASIPYGYYQGGPPTYDQVMSTSQSYQGRAADGCYVVMKMSEMGKWVSTNKSIYCLGTCKSNSPFYYLGLSQAFAEISAAHATTLETSWPYRRYLSPGEAPPYLWFAEAYKSMAVTFFTGLSAGSSIRLVNRLTMDMVVNSGSTYAPFVKRPPEEDPLAMQMYFRVSREMQDAYPSDHNNLGALLGVVGNLAKTVLPMVIPKLGSYITNKATAARTSGKGSWADLFASDNPLTQEEMQEMREFNAIVNSGQPLTKGDIARYNTLRAKALSGTTANSTLPIAAWTARRGLASFAPGGTTTVTVKKATNNTGTKKRKYIKGGYTLAIKRPRKT